MKKPNTTTLGRGIAAIFASLLLTAGITNVDAAGAVRLWDGGGDAVNWSDPANWDGDSSAPVAGDYLVFDGTAGLTNSNDLTADTSFSAITFPATAGAFFLSGNAIKLGANGITGGAGGNGWVTNESANVQTFDLEAKNDRTVRYASMGADIVNLKRLWDWRYYKSGPNDLLIKQTLSGFNGQVLGVDGGRLILNAEVGGPIGHGLQIDSGGTVVSAGPAQQLNTDYRANVTMSGSAVFQVQNTNSSGLPDFQQVCMLRSSSFDAIVENGSALGPVEVRVGGGSAARVGAYDGALRDGTGGGALAVSLINSSTYTYWRLGGTNSYTGATVVTNGNTSETRLLINGSHSGGGDYTVVGNAGGGKAYLGGAGSIVAGTVNVGVNGLLSPGGELTGAALYAHQGGGSANTGLFAESIGKLTIAGDVTLADASSTLDVHLNGTTAGAGYDQLDITGSGSLVNNSANLELIIDLGFVPAAGDKFTLVQVQGTDAANNVGVFSTLNGVAADLSQGATNSIGANSFRISYTAEGGTFEGAGNDIMIEFLVSSAANLTWKGNLSDDWDIGLTANWVNGGATTYTDLDNVTFDGTASSFNVELTTALNPTTIEVDATQNYLFHGAGKLTGAVVLTKTNTGALVIATDNDNGGTTTIVQGTVRMGTNSTVGTVSGSIVVNSGGVFEHMRQDDLALGDVSGAGAIVHSGDGKLIVTNDLTSFAGTLTNTGGTFQIGDGTTAGNGGKIGGTIIVPSSKSLYHNYNGSGNITVQNSLSGSGDAAYEFSAGDARTITFASTVTNTGFTGTTTVKTFTRMDVSTAAATPGGPIIVEGTTAPAFGSYYTHAGSSFTNLNSITIAGEGPASPVDTPRGKGALRLGNVWAGSVTLSGNATIGASGTGTVIGNIADGGNNYTLEYLGGTIQVGPAAGVQSYGPTVISEDYFGSYTSPTLTTVRALNSNAFSSSPVTMIGRARLELNGNDLSLANLVDGTLTTFNGTDYAPVVANNSGASAATLTVGSDNNSQTFVGTFINGSSQPLSLTKVGTGTMTLSGDSTCTGTVSVQGGTLALAAASGSFPNGNPITGSGLFGSAASIAVATGATFDVSGRTDGTLTLNAGQTLKHAGAGTGPITVTGNVNLGTGTLLFAINRSGFAHDSLAASGVVTYSGTLAITNIGAVLQAGDSFQLFPSGVSGFTAFDLPTADVVNNVQYTWNNTVASDGKITVASVSPLVNTTPGNLLTSVSGDTLSLSWPDHLGWSLQAQTNVLSVGLSNNWATMPGSETVTNMDITINPADPAVFYRLFYVAP